MVFLVQMGTKPKPAHARLIDEYPLFKEKLAHSAFGLPIYLESSDTQGTVYGVLSFPYATLEAYFSRPEVWCGVFLLHSNTKACTYLVRQPHCALILYNGNKDYETPSEAVRVAYDFNVVNSNSADFQVVLNAEKGPFFTKNYRMDFQAIPLTERSAFVRFEFSYQSDPVIRKLIAFYLATWGRNKIGFTVAGQDDEGNAVHIKGPRAILERNVIRYYLGILAFLETAERNEWPQVKKRFDLWYDLTGRYPKQLYEKEKDAYLRVKEKEWSNQQKEQEKIPPAAQKSCSSFLKKP